MGVTKSGYPLWLVDRGLKGKPPFQGSLFNTYPQARHQAHTWICVVLFLLLCFSGVTLFRAAFKGILRL